MSIEKTTAAEHDDQVAASGPGVGLLDRLAVWDAKVRTHWPFATLVPRIPQGSVDAETPGLLLRPAILGFVALAAIVAGSSQQRSPFALKDPGAWFFGVPASPNSPGSSHYELLGLVAVYGGLLLLIRVWYGLIRMVRQVPGIPVRKLVTVAAIWTVPLLIAPPLFSRDVYSYAAQGELMSRHISPYEYGVGVLGSTPMVNLVDPLWKDTPAPYGPLFMEVDGLLTDVAGHHELPDVVLLRLLEVGGVALIALGISMLARSYGRDPGYAVTLAVLNPVTILHLIGGAHNDGLMLGLLAVGLALAKRGRPVAGIVLCALAAAVKVPAAIGIVYIGWEWMGPRLPLRDRIRPLVSAGLIAGAVMGALSFVTGLGWSWVLNLATPGTVRSWVAPATGVGQLLTGMAHLVHVEVAEHYVLSGTRLLGLGVAAAAGVWLLKHVDRYGTLKALGITMLLVVILGPVVQPWYLSWGLILLAPIAEGRLRAMIVGFSIASAFIGLPGARQLIVDLFNADPLQVAISLLACLAVFTLPLTPFDREPLLARWRGRGGRSGSSPQPAALEPAALEPAAGV
ncbi:MAG TPA: polyprenol phosphomannose-dependent alpha 1,6 mannosyltransferase MptB [Acidimicrobiales bacterium]|nr:polyprenol phosphomannose-dependent alpha 1,6 mannosyltransferase MptB [Acidimicrobiales bacterium]